MPSPKKQASPKTRQEDGRPNKQDVDKLQKLQKLLSKNNLPSKGSPVEDDNVRHSIQWPLPHLKISADTPLSTESQALEEFSLTYQKERDLSHHPFHSHFTSILKSLVEHRLNNREWSKHAPPENILRVLICLRILLRDSAYQKIFYQLGGVAVLSQDLRKATDSYLTYGDGPFVVDILKEMTNIFQKLSAVDSQREWLVSSGAHKALVLLLSADDVVVLHCTMHTLISLAESASPMSLIAELNCIEMLLRILKDYDPLSKKLASILLRTLCGDSLAKVMVRDYDGIPLLLSLLQSENVRFLLNIVWCLVQLVSNAETSNDVRQMGGIPLLLSMLHERKFITERSLTAGLSSTMSPAIDEEMWAWPGSGKEMTGVCASPVTPTGPPSYPICPTKAPKHGLDCDTAGKPQTEDVKENLKLKSACCACLSELVINDINAQHVVRANGIWDIALLIFPQKFSSRRDQETFHTLQTNAFRTLRFLFSMERNRRLFKRLFPPDLFEMFIDIGHYKRELEAYHSLVEKINTISVDDLDKMRENLNSINQNKAPTHFIGEYAVIEYIASGAFGSVYKVKKRHSVHTYLAVKEVNTLNPSWGKNSKERQKSIGDVISELTIIREQMKHPSVVRYYKTFTEQDKLYIVMDLIEGAPLAEHFTSLKEKDQKFSEERIWNIFIQIVLALRYLHKEKNIVHRDLTPNNIMLGEGDKITITDFGLAKQKQKDCSKMTSVVGTILYSCPEIVQSKPYGEKADIWAIGCILYQMCTLEAPFYSTNMLCLATKIVNADYEPIPAESYSKQVVDTVAKCITADPAQRPDSVGVAAYIADRILLHMDAIHRENSLLEKRLEKERRKTQRHFSEAQRETQKYHNLFLVTQERYDKLANLSGSGGASSVKDESENMFTDIEASKLRTGSNILSSNTTSDLYDSHHHNGWGSEEDSLSSSCDSRGSSAGHGGPRTAPNTLPLPPQPRPPEQGQPRAGRRRMGGFETSAHVQLSVDTGSGKSSGRDSGFLSSGDLSPNYVLPDAKGTSGPVYQHSISCESSNSSSPTSLRVSSAPAASRTSIEAAFKRAANGKQRPTSALTVAKEHLREINDPILCILTLVHKIMYITQLPPSLCHNPRRRLIERYKRSLFAAQSTSANLKNEMRKLQMNSREIIDLNFGPSESPKLARQVSLEQEALAAQSDSQGLGICDSDTAEIGITYEQMNSILESVLADSGYYDISPQIRHAQLSRTMLAVTHDSPSSQKPLRIT